MAIDRYYITKDYTEADTAQFMSLSHSGMTAAFLHSSKVLHLGNTAPLCTADVSLRAIARKGAVYLPVGFFADYLGCVVKEDGESCEIICKDKLVRLKADCKESFTNSPIMHDGALYVPAIEVADALDIAAGAFYDGQLVVFGTAEHIRTMNENERLAEAGSFAVVGEYDPSLATAEDYAEAKRVFRLRLVGSPEINDMSDPLMAGKINARSEDGKKFWAKMNKGENVPILWGDSKPVESAELSTQYNSLRALAYAWGTYGSEYYHNEELLRDILFGLEWMYQNMYGEAEMRNEGWRDVFACNWWYWFVGGPRKCKRYKTIKVQFQTLEMKTHTKNFTGWTAQIIQHEVDHCNGILI